RSSLHRRGRGYLRRLRISAGCSATASAGHGRLIVRLSTRRAARAGTLRTMSVRSASISRRVLRSAAPMSEDQTGRGGKSWGDPLNPASLPEGFEAPVKPASVPCAPGTGPQPADDELSRAEREHELAASDVGRIEAELNAAREQLRRCEHRVER